METLSQHSSLQAWIDGLLAMHQQEIDLGLERVSDVARRLEVTRPAEFVISVAGTNGKGSSVAMLSAVLDAQGYRVGTYTSPHILRFNERIQINGQPVEDREIVEAFVEIEAIRGQTKLTYFEFSTLAALLIFKRHKVDVAVLEVGLGGRLDAVNLVDADAALITAIDVDHVDWLGDDRAQIALEKAGITRAGKPAVCSDPHPPATLAAFASAQGVPLWQLAEDFSFQKTQQAGLITFKHALTQDWPAAFEFPQPALLGEFQWQNAAGVVALLARIGDQLPVSLQSLASGLTQVKHPGRLQQFTVVTPSGQQQWLVDVAHNPQSAQALADYLASQEDSRQAYISLFSVLNDKDSLPMVKQLAPYIAKWMLADLQIPRASSLERLQQLMQQADVSADQVGKCTSMEQAVTEALAMPAKKVLVWGSFFTVSQVLEALHRQAQCV
ncbi:bifunctional folylpolyglutamate synthase/dihydrofolate synthase [Thiomicrorhabdus cannonii]|uniref:bifunctional folylpolyglutamate synthase/dihydrofolate synthase n=1 Tax=Thiomicrorhabdus cannonii TaxID=2748011 RepID=UPI0015B882A8|nr:folylpolyglutamate synthase/dihydrofolate synthase family protein [Thiomicrorhabdus cannonii]